MTWLDYQASVVGAKVNDGPQKPSINEVILESLKSFPGGCKREELCSQVAARTGISFGEVSACISGNLTRLKRSGHITHVTTGYWRAN